MHCAVVFTGGSPLFFGAPHQRSPASACAGGKVSTSWNATLGAFGKPGPILGPAKSAEDLSLIESFYLILDPQATPGAIYRKRIGPNLFHGEAGRRDPRVRRRRLRESCRR